ncbi:MAG: efflux RND transporter periplasmic adaptor subunit [Candidatus Omnitrophica bacterium]|nr:efflux RND transporter periplasmic adaptor subunit [Candidatus Omnitrophota bacterium]
MIKNKKGFIVAGIILCAVVFLMVRSNTNKGQPAGKETKIINPGVGSVKIIVTTTGVVEPQNRLEIKPSISGRIEEILVKEGDEIRKGDILAWMSSTERASLVDAAHSQGEEALKYWEEVYKKTPIISPIDGEIIVRPVEPGQTVAASDVVLVLSDRLVVSGQFDETDIGRVRKGQDALITLDAYPEVQLEGVVDHVAYESEIVSNVTIYNVDILPEDMPDMMRSGMSVTVEVIEKKVDDVMTIPASAIHYDGERQYVLVQDHRNKITERDIKIGLNNDQTAEVISGLSAEDSVIAQDTAYLPKRKKSGTNPFLPQRKR